MSGEDVRAKRPMITLSGKSVPQGTSASSLDNSENSFLNTHFDSGRFEHAASSAGSDASSYEGGLSIEDSTASFSRALLKVGVPTPVGSKPGLYSVRIRRASLRQSFGVVLVAKRGGDISVAEDLPHLGMRSGDQLVEVNGERPQHVERCRSLLAKASNVLLVLQHRGDPGRTPMLAQETECGHPTPSHTGGYTPLRVLLSASPPVLTDASNGEFAVEICRSSLKQRFGVTFTEHLCTAPGEQNCLCISEDMPHIGLRMGDRVLSINDVPVASVVKCRQELADSMVLRLILRRVLAPLSMPTFLEPIDERGHPTSANVVADARRPVAAGLRPFVAPEMRLGKQHPEPLDRPCSPLTLWGLLSAPLCCASVQGGRAEFDEVAFVESQKDSMSF